MDLSRLIRSIAHHEAGHAYVGAFLGRRIEEIQIFPSKLDGQVRFKPAPLDHKREALIFCAGIEAQRIADEPALEELLKLNPEHGENDRLSAMALLSSLQTNTDDLGNALDRAFDDSAAIVAQQGALQVILQLANELVANAILPGDTAHNIIGIERDTRI
jgi:hypothetical protein